MNMQRETARTYQQGKDRDEKTSAGMLTLRAHELQIEMWCIQKTVKICETLKKTRQKV